MKTIKQGETSPYGLFKREQSYSPPKLCLRIPLFVGRGQIYHLHMDQITHGWFALEIFVSWHRPINSKVDFSLAWARIALGKQKPIPRNQFVNDKMDSLYREDPARAQMIDRVLWKTDRPPEKEKPAWYVRWSKDMHPFKKRYPEVKL